MKQSMLLLFLCLCAGQIFAQAPAIEWQNTIGGASFDQLKAIQQTSDGGYILGGSSGSDISGDKTENSLGGSDYWVVKLDASGTVVWQNTIGGSSFENFSSVRQTSDGGYILGGYSDSPISGDKTENSLGGNDFWVVKLDAAGAIVWQNTIGGSGEDLLRDVKQTSDGGYVLGGRSASNISGDKTENNIGVWDYWVVKLDAAGAIVWQNTIGGTVGEEITSLQQTSDGGYILAGWSFSNANGDKTENNQTAPGSNSGDYWIIKLDAVGAIVWQNTIGGSSGDEPQSIQQTTDGGYIVGGWSDSNISGDKTENRIGTTDYWVLKLDAVGNIQWQNTIGGTTTEFCNSVKQTSDGGYILGGRSNSNISADKTENSRGGQDYWVVKLDAAGNILWDKTIGGSASINEILYAVQETSDGGYILGGHSESNISGDKTENSNGSVDYWVVKLEGNCPLLNFSLTIAPQPCLGKTKITVSTPTGGTGPYLFKLDAGNFGTSKIFTVTLSGDHTITVKDANDCTTSQTENITVTPKLAATVIKTKALCFGQANGTATANPSGGTPGYSHQWKQGATVLGTDPSIGGLAAGAYQLVVTDAANCPKTVNFTIAQPPLLTLAVGSVVPQGANFKVVLAATGGTAPRMYRRCDADGNNCGNWQTSTTFQNMPAGTYQFQVKDLNICTATVNSPVPPAALPSAAERVGSPTFSAEKPGFDLAPNPARDRVQILFSENAPAAGQLEIRNLDGKTLRSMSLETLAKTGGWIFWENQSPGVFLVSVRTENGPAMVRKLVVH